MVNSIQHPWLVAGDFNVIKNKEVKPGGLPVIVNETNNFNYCISMCNLEECAFKESKYTWWNGRMDEECIFKRLDRVSINDKMQELFPIMELENLIATLEEVIKVRRNQFEEEPLGNNRAKLSPTQAELTIQLKRKEDYWRQKTDFEWFKDRQRNTKFFYIVVKRRRSRLRIQNKKGNWMEIQEDIAEAAESFF
ncbi:uncharacterized protein LOC107858150 [Capsicum annuum]|uniref:uncharacterized protein LOC107858150 n=1 Tax=Capsicum annuum TaxID=4072 RepID=UPI0007BF5B7E|nr:uncharacterized protein LOC107858150 [Capsicum annuum]